MRRIVIMSTAAAVALAFGGAGANAAEKALSPCKGLAEAACKTDTQCSWVKASKTKAGKEIAAYCRLKSGKKAAPAAAPKS